MFLYIFPYLFALIAMIYIFTWIFGEGKQATEFKKKPPFNNGGFFNYLYSIYDL